ncbi:MAG: MFS transporter [Sphingomonas fennica]
MAQAGIIDVAEVIERQSLGRFVIRLIALSCAITFFDGFDMQVIAYAATYLTDDFGLSRPELGNLFAIGTLGTMIGGFLFGYWGDRYGRRPTIIAASFAFGILTFAFALSQTYTQLMVLRFLNGIAIGGMLPLCWALNIEYVPRRFRATVVTTVMLGYTLGTSFGAPITLLLAPTYGWQAIFVFGGVATILIAMMLWWGLPESPRYLASKKRRPDLIARYLNGVEPSLGATPADRFVLSDEAAAGSEKFRLPRLFDGSLRWITPLLWSAYIASSLAIYFKTSWSPLVLEMLGYTRAQAAGYSSISSIGSAVGGLLLMRFTDKRGPIAIAAMAAISAPILFYVGLADLGPIGFLGLNFVVTVLLGGAHYGMHSIAGMFYQSAFRANGAAWATSIAKIGSIAGPLVGGWILATQFPVQHIYALLGVCPALLALCLFLMTRVKRRPGADEAAVAAG